MGLGCSGCASDQRSRSANRDPAESHEAVAGTPLNPEISDVGARTRLQDATEPDARVVADASSEELVNRGRGPEIPGTRITIYRIMDFFPYTTDPVQIAQALSISEDQVRIALDYINRHEAEVRAQYQAILDRVRSRTAHLVDQPPRTREELRSVLGARRGGDGDHDRPLGQ